MSKKFKEFETGLTPTDNKVSVTNGGVGEYAFINHNLVAVGTWNPTQTVDASTVYNKFGSHTWNVNGDWNGTTFTSVSLISASGTKALRILPNYTDVAILISGVKWTFTGGDDIGDSTLIEMLNTYFNKE